MHPYKKKEKEEKGKKKTRGNSLEHVQRTFSLKITD